MLVCRCLDIFPTCLTLASTLLKSKRQRRDGGALPEALLSLISPTLIYRSPYKVTPPSRTLVFSISPLLEMLAINLEMHDITKSLARTHFVTFILAFHSYILELYLLLSTWFRSSSRSS